MTKKYHKNRIFSALLAVVTACTFALTPSVGAVDGDSNEPEHKVFPSISPVNEIVSLDPGTSHSNTFKVGNRGSETISFKIYADPYQESGDDATPNYSVRTKYNDIVNWITFDKEGGIVAPGEHVDINYTINVPKDAAGGGQYAALIVEAKNDANGQNEAEVNEITRVAYLLYADIDGEIDNCVKIHNNNINTFMFEPPISATSLVENCGNVHQAVTYNITVYPLFSDKPIYSNSEEPMKRTVLPENRRFNTISWTKEDGAPSIGIYNVEQTVKIGNETSTEKKLVFIFPLWLLIVIALFIVALIFWIVSRARARKEESSKK